MSHIKSLFLLLPLLGCGHDAGRVNPLDPELTPSVVLQVATANDSSGTVSLTWSSYNGSQRLAEYWVLRNVTGEVRVDTVAVLDAAHHTYRDSGVAPGTYDYRVSVLNLGGYEAVSPARTVVLNNTLIGTWSALWTTAGGIVQHYQLEMTLLEDGLLVVDYVAWQGEDNAFLRFHNEGTWVTDGSLLTLDYHEGLYEPVIEDGVLRFCKQDEWDSVINYDNDEFTGTGKQLTNAAWTNLTGQVVVFRPDGSWEMTALLGSSPPGGTWEWQEGLVKIRRRMSNPYALVGPTLHFSNPGQEFNTLLVLRRGSAERVVVDRAVRARFGCQ